MGLISLAAILIGICLGWVALYQIVKSISSYPSNKHICLLIAHPDDEAMFFSPTVIRLADPTLNNTFEILCLCPGQEPTLRSSRTSELIHSASNLGLDSPKRVTVIDDEDSFPDSMTIFWSAEKIAKVLSSHFSTEPAAPGSGPDMLITFENHGISSHANHISLLHGATYWLKHMSAQSRNAVALYSLTTTNLVRKYTSLLDAPLSLLLYLTRHNSASTTATGFADRYIFFSAFSSYRRAQRSMTACHKSQMLWFRYGWIALSRYVSTNDLQRINV
ncbi:N-acetylglucosaminyl-phosphatidylinositol de-N-acetylase [Vermiconidia calcicola]|uniref:N-acetylglucosaminyl-phosphatidylinositol de-N-acetylase n=1 Tax=Vermiconidia calcicola TaxID=1690605 RepID=A0ACC3NKY7_9PEZI|nr:N-acetylglucosaminyl-phosphatidylinositol de-N-acetylase [Vermiconidia calcicola]